MSEISNGNCSVSKSDDADLKPVCRVCLAFKRPLVSLYDKLSHKICDMCSNFLLKAVRFKRMAEASDKKLREKLDPEEKPKAKKIQFDSFKQVKKEISNLNIKSDPEVKIEIEVIDTKSVPPQNDTTGKDFLICNTVIKKLDSSTTQSLPKVTIPETNIMPGENIPKQKTELAIDFDDDFGGRDFENDSDEDYIPLAQCKSEKSKKSKSKMKKLKTHKVTKIKYKYKKNNDSTLNKSDNSLLTVIREEPVLLSEQTPLKTTQEGNATYITCYPLLKNGTKGPPLILKRPKDSTVLKKHPNYKPRAAYRKSNNAQSSQDKVQKTMIKVHGSKNPNKLRPSVMKPREKLVCPVCGVLTYALGNHMAIHAEKKRYTCPECNKSFAQKNNMLVHSKRHSGVKDHICEVCGSGFYSQKSLIRHNLIHKGERPYECNLCPKKFIARCDLLRHLRIHSGYKPFKCTECSMSFNAKHQLQNHERMHTGEKPFTCQVCNVAFSYKVNLNNHVLKVHGINLKFKSIHTFTEEVLRKEHELLVLQPPQRENMGASMDEEKIQTSQSHVY